MEINIQLAYKKNIYIYKHSLNHIEKYGNKHNLFFYELNRLMSAREYKLSARFGTSMSA